MINMDVPEIDPNFEPQQRARSNTWPLRPQEFVEKEPGDPKTPTIDESPEAAKQDPLGLAKKTSSRRNAWGNLSYADLITKAIQSSPEQRLTLSQIYDWMVQSVPYFKDKGDSNSSAGWKNSIRHNLSLHSRFMRMQNEGTGKSSWWVLNPEAKPGKSPRRRATSMDTKAYEKKRGRVKKKVDALRAGNSPSSSDFGEGNELLEDPSLVYSLSPQDFRQRTSSNASSIGRLSPIPAVEPDLHDSQVPPMSPIPWNDIPANYNGAQDQYTDSLQTSLANMMVGDPSLSPIGPQDLNDELLLSQGNGIGFQQNAGLMAAPPSYDASLRRSPQSMMQGNVGGTINRALIANQSMQGVPLSNGLGTTLNGGSSTFMTQALDVLQSDSLYAQEPITNQDPMMSIGGEVNGMNPSQMNQYTTLNSLNLNSNSAFQSQSLRALNVIQQGQQRQQMLSSQQQQQQQRMVSSLPQRQQQSDSLLRQALTQSKQNLFQRVTAGQQMVAPQSTVSPMYSSNSQQVYSQAGTLIQNQQQTPQSMQHALQTTLPNDLEIALSELKGFDCDVDQIINHELTMEGSLECNFDAFNSGNQMQTNTDGEYISMQLGQT